MSASASSAPPAPASTHRAASVEFDHVTKSYDAKATKAGGKSKSAAALPALP